MLPEPSDVVAYVCHEDRQLADELATRLLRSNVFRRACPVVHPSETPSNALFLLLAVHEVEQARCDLSELRGRLPRAILVAACRRPGVNDVVTLMRSGADAVVDLLAGGGAVAHGVRAALADGSYVPPNLQAAVASETLRRRRDTQQQRTRLASLTAQELAILRHLADGENRDTIARRVGEPVHRVRGRIDRAKAKLGVRSQRQAVVMVTEHLTAQG